MKKSKINLILLSFACFISACSQQGGDPAESQPSGNQKNDDPIEDQSIGNRVEKPTQPLNLKANTPKMEKAEVFAEETALIASEEDCVPIESNVVEQSAYLLENVLANLEGASDFEKKELEMKLTLFAEQIQLESASSRPEDTLRHLDQLNKILEEFSY